MQSDTGMDKQTEGRQFAQSTLAWLGLADQTDVYLFFALYILLYCSDRNEC